MQKIIYKSEKGLKGTVTIPSDKSISHRAIMFTSLARGKSVIKNFSKGQDPLSSLKVCKALGIDAEFSNEELIVKSKGILSSPQTQLDCGNSGTTMRLMSGILAGQNFNSTLIGDESLSKRPMKRVIEPLSIMGAKIESNEYKAPLKIYGQSLKPINYISKLASAQVKSCILLAGLNIDGQTSFTEPYVSRNHTEIMLKYMGANISVNNTTVTIKKSELEPKTIEICGDISSAAYFIVAGLIVPNSKIILKNVGLNPTRTGILEVAEKMGGNIEILDKRNISGEDVGDIQISYSNLNACTIEGEIIPRLIDELPVIAVLATQATGTTIIKDAQDLRNKESDRIKAVVTELKKIGADIEETPDGFIINGKTNLKGDTEVETYHDHRLAMSLYAAGLICDKPIRINGFEWVDISFPEFDKLFNSLTL
uniref:3-phosphoshikimate 1-carboxyvinyltransferase n=1 Tax=Candidatus Stercorousia sp. TaxID=3048886 RepID=UPI00402609FC